MAFAAIVLFSVAGVAAGSTAQGPAVFVDAPVHDFGVARRQQRLEHRFLIRNRGGADLLVEDVRSTCDCTIGDLRKRRIPSGSAMPLEVVLETRNHKGALKRTIELHTNDPQSPILKLEVTARVCTDFAIEPQSLLLQRRAGGSPLASELRLIRCSDQPLSLMGVDVSAPWLESSWEPAVGGHDGDFVIRVRANGRLPVGHQAAVLSVYVEQGKRSVVDVPVILRAGSGEPRVLPDVK